MLRHSVPSLSVELWKHRVLSVETQRRALARHHSEENVNIKYFVSPNEIEPTTYRIYSLSLWLCAATPLM